MRLLTGGLFVLAALPALAAGLTQADRQLNIESFEKVWTTVRDRHWDTTYNGVDWQAAHEEFRPRVEKAKSNAESREAMEAMLALLKQTHFAIIGASAYEEIATSGGGDGTPGIDTRLIEGHVLVTSVLAGSPAAAAGIRPGWDLRAIDGESLAQAIAKIARSFRDDVMQPSFLVRQMVQARMGGAVGSRVTLSLLDADGTPRSIDVERTRPRGVLARFGNLPPLYVWAESRKPRPNIGYIAFNLFFDPENIMKAVGDMVSGCSQCDGMIVDLRGNPGGIGGMAMGMAGFFVDTPGRKLGTMVMRSTKLQFAVNPRPRAFRGRLAILVDECSVSTSEIFAEGMKDLGRARIFGTRTAGAALPSIFERLPNGDGFQYAFADYISESGKRLEGAGVDPDVEAPLSRKALLDGHDPALDAAIEWIGTAPKKGQPT